MAEEKDPLGLQQTKSIYRKNRGRFIIVGFLIVISLILFIGFALTGLLSGPLLALPIAFLVGAAGVSIKMGLDRRSPLSAATQGPVVRSSISELANMPPEENKENTELAHVADDQEKDERQPSQITDNQEKDDLTPSPINESNSTISTAPKPSPKSEEAISSPELTPEASLSEKPSPPAELTPEETFEAYKEAAEGGDRMAKYRLAECYEFGTGCVQSFENAFKIYNQLIKYEYYDDEAKVMAYRRLAEWYEKGIFVKKDPIAACGIYLNLAQHNAEFSYRSGTAYEKMADDLVDRKRDLELSLQWLESALWPSKNTTMGTITLEMINSAIARVSQKIAHLNEKKSSFQPPLFEANKTPTASETIAEAAEPSSPHSHNNSDPAPIESPKNS